MPTTAATDFRERPDRYRIGRGESNVFHTPPYTGELLPLWRFRTPADARRSAAALLARFEAFRDAGDFVGMDVARKFLQMGYTRSRRYANHRGGRKYAADGSLRPPDPDPVKAESAAVFREVLEQVKADPVYHRAKAAHLRRARSSPAGGG